MLYIDIPESGSVFKRFQTARQIGVHKFLSSSVNEHKNHQPIPFPIHTPLEFPSYCGFSTITFRYMIKNKYWSGKAALGFCRVFEKFAAQLGDCLSLKDF